MHSGIWSSQESAQERSPVSLVISSAARTFAVGMDRQVKLWLGPPTKRALFLCLPVAETVDLKTDGINHPIDRSGRLLPSRGKRQTNAAPGKRDVVGNLEAHG